LVSNHSKKREIIYHTISRSNEHPTADMLYARLKPDYPELSLGTVYRNLLSLCEEGRIMRLSVPKGPERYDCNCWPHYHMICNECGCVYDIRLASLPDLKTARLIDGHHITTCDVIFRGVCTNCSKKKS